MNCSHCNKPKAVVVAYGASSHGKVFSFNAKDGSSYWPLPVLPDEDGAFLLAECYSCGKHTLLTVGADARMSKQEVAA